MRIGLKLVPLLAAVGLSTAWACEDKLRVAIDVGHDVKSGGAISASARTEYSYNLRLATELVDELRSNRLIDAFLIEKEGKQVSLGERRARAKARRADALISIHHDSAQPQFLTEAKVSGRTVRYTELFEGFSLFYSEDNAKPQLSLETARSIGRSLTQAGLYPTDHHAMDVEGERREMVDPRNGVYRYDGLGVLKGDMASVLIEAAVIVNPREEERINNPAYRRQITRAIASGLESARCSLSQN